MDLNQWIEFFQWLTIINMGLFILNVLLIIAFKNLLARMHSRLFGISQETILNITYGWLGVYKIFIIVFNLVPYLALLLMQ